ncbi:hypothetical protein V8E54_002638 [Elaphomyces granulatus]
MSALRPALGEEENDQIHEEIDLVVRMRVAKLASDLELDRHIKDKLENKPLTMKDRTYLWLYLAIDDIYETYRHSVRPEETSIDTLPSTVGDAYEKILGRGHVPNRSRDGRCSRNSDINTTFPATGANITAILNPANAIDPHSGSWYDKLSS